MSEPIVEDDYSQIPAELRDRRQWLLWDASADTPRRPHWNGNFSVSWTDPNDWHSFEEAVELARGVESWGIGYVFSDLGPYTFIDLDGCLTSRGGPKDWLPALDPFLEEAYIETSASGTGLHVIIEDFDEPDWWSDSHFSDDEHEGIEVYEQKFCAFTGSPIDASAKSIGDIDAAEWLVQAYKSVNGEDPFSDHADELREEQPDYNRNDEELLAEDDIREALEHIDPDVSYSTWRDIGFALKDFFQSSTTALSVFRDWSRGGSKWDSDAEDQAKRIIKDATAGGGRTIGTVVYYAKQGGWEYPYKSSNDGPQSSVDVDDSEVDRGEAILEMQTGPDDPVGENFVAENGGYGIYWEYTDEDGNITSSGVDPVCNFTLETLSYLSVEDQPHDEFVVRVRPSHPTEQPYDVRIAPAVFNSAEQFRKEVVTGRTTWFDPTNREGVRTITILRYLRETVAAQAAPERVGQPYIGLSDCKSEYVTPDGVLTPDGWSDDPDHEYYSVGGDNADLGPFAQKWSLSPDDDAEIEEGIVREICELLPNTRVPERGLPVYGWFYAAPLKTYIHDWESEFPILAPHADTGAGKTSTLETFVEAFGGSGEPLSSTDTKFTKEKHLAESRGFPVWIDEYKPTEMPDHVIDHLHQRLKEVTKERMMPKGRPDLGIDQLHMRAPVILSGEQKISDPAVRRRSLLTNLSREATRDATETKAAFGKLTGIAYEDETGDQHYPEGYDLSHHALAYYRWALARDAETIKAWWHEARDEMASTLEDFGVTLEASEQRAIQTMIFGVRLATEFATEYGADTSQLPTDQDIRDAVDHVIGNIGKDGHRREHADDFLELLSLAATEEYIERGVHFRIVNSQKYDCDALAVHMPSTFTAVKKYLREYNLEDEYTVLNKTDYLDSFSNKTDVEGNYVLAVNQRVRNLDNGTKAVYFDPGQLKDTLGSDFNKTAFIETEDDDNAGESVDEHEIEAIAALDVGFHAEIVAEVVSVDAGEYSREAQGTLKGPHGTRLGFVVPGGNDDPISGKEGESVSIQHAKIRTDADGLKEVVINDAVEVTDIDDSEAMRLGDATDEPESVQPASDGGQEVPESDDIGEPDDDEQEGKTAETETPAEELVLQLATAKAGNYDARAIPHDELVRLLVEEGVGESKAEHVIEKHRHETGELFEPKSDHYRRT